jgi:ketosteroid isomerase-like protein
VNGPETTRSLISQELNMLAFSHARRLACGLMFTLSLIPGMQAQSQATAASALEDSVRAVEMARGRALTSADTVALSRLVADEFVEVSRLGQLRSKADNMREIATGDLKLTTVKYDSLTVRVYGDVAVLRGMADNTGTYRGFPFTGKIRYTRVFVRRDGRWQAVAMQQTAMQ